MVAGGGEQAIAGTERSEDTGTIYLSARSMACTDFALDIPRWTMRNRFLKHSCMDSGCSHCHDFSTTHPIIQSPANVPTTADQFASTGAASSIFFHLRG